MADPQKQNHWAELLSSMGISPPSEPEPKPSPTASIESPTNAPSAVPSPVMSERPRPVRKRADWGQLADDLGIVPQAPPRPCESVRTIEVPPEIVPPEPIDSFSISDQDQDGAEELETTAAEAWQSELVELNDPLFLDGAVPEGVSAHADAVSAESGTMAEEPLGEIESIPAAEAALESVANGEEQSVGGSDERRGRRRRRRRRKVRRDDREGSPVDERSLGETTSADSDLVEESLDATAAREAEDDDDSEAGRRKRRRRRRKKRPVADSTGEAAAGLAKSDSDSGAWDEHEGLESHDEEVHYDDDDDKVHLSHRGIPTWEQAIEVVIAKNLDARAKNPNAGQSRGRGGRKPRDRRN